MRTEIQPILIFNLWRPLEAFDPIRLLFQIKKFAL